MQILRDTPATLELKVYSSGDLTDLDANPTLAVTDANGDAVSSGTITKPSIGVYRSVLAGQADLKTLKAVWSGDLGGDAVSFTQHYEIVGNLLFTEAEARGARFTGQQSPLSDETAYPDAVIARMREQIARNFEQKTGRSWTRRYCRMELHGNGWKAISLLRGQPVTSTGDESGGPGRLWNARKLISVSVDDVDVTANARLDGRNILLTTGTFARATFANPFNVVVEYEYGDDPVDLEARENGLRTIVANLVPSDVPDYAQTISSSNESTSFQQQEQGTLRVYPAKTREWLKRNPPRRIPGVA